MGRASSVRPCTSHIPSLDAVAPMENSPPGIHTIPSGAGPGGGPLLGTVGANAASRSGAATACGTALCPQASSRIAAAPAVAPQPRLLRIVALAIDALPSSRNSSLLSARNGLAQGPIPHVRLPRFAVAHAPTLPFVRSRALARATIRGRA